MTPFDLRTGLRFLGALAFCTLWGALVSAMAGAAAHLVVYGLFSEGYEMAIGDGLLPSSPIESAFWAPVLIGAFVTWWVGTIAAPFLLAAGFIGPRPVPPVRSFVASTLGGWLAGALGILGLVALDGGPRGAWGAALLSAVVERGYWALALALAVMIALLGRARFLSARRIVKPA